MRRVIAAVAAAGLLANSGSTAMQHVHAYGDHDHADHHHGPAVHGHRVAGHHHGSMNAEPQAEIEGCDPGAHVVAVVFTCAAPHSQQIPVSIAGEPWRGAPPRSRWRITDTGEVRAHGPPPFANAPSRAPPPVHPA